MASDVIFYNHIKDLLDACLDFYDKHQQSLNVDRIQERRRRISEFIEKFHKESGTLTPVVRNKIDTLKQGHTIILMTAHQPNLFPYSGVLRKATLIHVIKEEIEQRIGVDVVNFFGIADQDFTDDRWVKSAQLPSILRRGGILTLRIKLPTTIMLKDAPKPSQEILESWRQQMENWLMTANRLTKKTLETVVNQTFELKPLITKLNDNFNSFWKLVRTAHLKSDSYADFNGFLMSLIVNKVWKYDTLFSRFSECQQVFSKEFEFLCAHFNEYDKSFQETSEAKKPPLNTDEGALAPFWYHCHCGGKARLFLVCRGSKLLTHGKCTNCNREYMFDLGTTQQPRLQAIMSRVSARAIPMALIFFRGLGVTCYVGGVGGREYLSEAQNVSRSLDIPFPPLTVWRPHDRYVSLSSLESIAEIRRIKEKYHLTDICEAYQYIKQSLHNKNDEIAVLEHEKQKLIEELKRAKTRKTLVDDIKRLAQVATQLKSDCNILRLEEAVFDNKPMIENLIPSIIDYAVNVGLYQTSKQWIEHLVTNGDLVSDVPLQSIWSSSITP